MALFLIILIVGVLYFLYKSYDNTTSIYDEPGDETKKVKGFSFAFPFLKNKCKMCDNSDDSIFTFTCSKCGAKHSKLQLITVSSTCIILILLVSSAINIPSKTNTGKESLSGSISYLKSIKEVEWVSVDGNDVYIGFNQFPNDFKTICKGAALRGNEEIDFGVHVWAIDANRYSNSWRPGSGSYQYEVTARHGRIE